MIKNLDYLILKSPWAGTPESYAIATKMLSSVSSDLTTAAVSTPVSGEDAPKLYQVQDGVAVIPVKGPMLDIDFPDYLADLFGITTYPGLRRKFFQAMADEDVTSVVLDINSGGGHVSGLKETRDILKQLKAEKPVSVFAGDMMASAAYWLGSAGGHITASSMSTVGSIGVINVHIEAKGAYEMEGLKPTVIRAGDNKHLGHQLEPFTDKARADIQERLDFIHANFLQDVAESRNISVETVADTIGDGKCFYGNNCLSNKLVDAIGKFEDVMAASVKSQPVENPRSAPSYRTAASSNVLPVEASKGDPSMTLDEATAKIEKLNAQIKASEEALAEANAAAAVAKSALATVEATNTALANSLAAAEGVNKEYSDVLAKNIEAKAVALGVTVLMPDTIEDRRKMNAQLEEKFQAKFPSGGVAAVGESGGNPTADVPEWVHRVVLG